MPHISPRGGRDGRDPPEPKDTRGEPQGAVRGDDASGGRGALSAVAPCIDSLVMTVGEKKGRE
jgi:hypothetical protein